MCTMSPTVVVIRLNATLLSLKHEIRSFATQSCSLMEELMSLVIVVSLPVLYTFVFATSTVTTCFCELLSSLVSKQLESIISSLEKVPCFDDITTLLMVGSPVDCCVSLVTALLTATLAGVVGKLHHPY